MCHTLLRKPRTFYNYQNIAWLLKYCIRKHFDQDLIMISYRQLGCSKFKESICYGMMTMMTIMMMMMVMMTMMTIMMMMVMMTMMMMMMMTTMMMMMMMTSSLGMTRTQGAGAWVHKHHSKHCFL